MSDELPPGWVRTTLGEICDINPRRFDRPIADDDRLSLVPMAAVDAGTGRLDPSRTVRYGDVKRKTLTPFQDGDVVFAKVTPCMENGKIALAAGLHGGRALGSTEFFVLRPGGAVLATFLLRFLLQKSVRLRAERSMSGAVGLRRVPRSFMTTCPIDLPPLDEQRRILQVSEDRLLRLEDGERALSRIIDRATQLRLRIAGFARPGPGGTSHDTTLLDAGTDDGKLPVLPPRWRWVRLGDIADVVGGVTKDSKRQSDLDYVEVPYLRVANVQRGYLDLSRVDTIRVPATKAESLRLKRGDVLLNEGGDRDKLGRGWIWEEQIANCIHQNHVFRVRIEHDMLHPTLLAWHTNGFGKSWCDRNGRQSVNLASISLSKIKLMPVPLPPRDVQDELVERVEAQLTAVDTAIGAAAVARTRVGHLRNALLRQAFSGRLVPQNPFDEPAAVLLERLAVGQAVMPTPRRGQVASSRKAPAGTSAMPHGDQQTLL